MKLESVVAKFLLLIFGLIVFYFLSLGLVTTPWEGDSLAYHLPLAEKISQWQFSHYDNLLYYYPATVHVWLASFKMAHLPLQWFNVVGLILFFGSTYWLGRRLNLTQSTSLILAVTLAMLTPLARLITTQTVDIYLAVLYTLLLGHLFKPEANVHYFIRLGLLAGGLVGAKYTGPLFLMVFLPVFAKSIFKVANVSRMLVAILLVIGVGGIWYLRNWLLMGDPIYPAHHPNFSWVNWQTWQTIIQAPGGWWLFLESLISEYLFWPLLILGLGYLAIRKSLTHLELTLTLLGIGNFVVHLLTPTSINNVLSDLRYTAPTFICLIIAAFLVAVRHKQQFPLLMVSVTSVLASFSLIMPHRPKVFALYIVVLGIGWWCWQKLPKNWLKSKFDSKKLL